MAKRSCGWAIGAGIGAPGWCSPLPASAYTVYVTNEKDNTVTVIDSETLEVVKTVKVGQRPRGIILAKDGKWLLICASDDNTVQVFDTGTMEFVEDAALRPRSRSSSSCTRPATRSTSPTRTTTSSPSSTSQTGTVMAEIPVGVEPEGMGISPDGKMLVNTSETTNMAHFIDTATNEIIDNVLVDSRPRVAEFTARRQAAVGQRRDRRHGHA